MSVCLNNFYGLKNVYSNSVLRPVFKGNSNINNNQRDEFVFTKASDSEAQSNTVSTYQVNCPVKTATGKVKNTQEILSPNYSDTKEFSVYLEAKIKTMLKEKSVDDIKLMITRISKYTGADEKLVREVIAGLSIKSYGEGIR